jgi:hypothetical protein
LAQVIDLRSDTVTRVKKAAYFSVLAAAVTCSGCFDASQKTPPTVYGIYSLHTSDRSIHHGVDPTYLHIYSKGSSGKDLTQRGTWTRDGNSILFGEFIAWDLGGPLPGGVMYPDPAGFASLNGLMQELSGNYEITMNSDRGQRFVQIERFVSK